MEELKILYQKEIANNIVDYEQLVNKYLKLLYGYWLNIDPHIYKNLAYLKLVVVGFNYCQNEYIGMVNITNDNIEKITELWININKNMEIHNMYDNLLLISFNIINDLKMTYPNICQSILLNLFSIYEVLNINNNQKLS